MFTTFFLSLVMLTGGPDGPETALPKIVSLYGVEIAPVLQGRTVPMSATLHGLDRFAGRGRGCLGCEWSAVYTIVNPGESGGAGSWNEGGEPCSWSSTLNPATFPTRITGATASGDDGACKATTDDDPCKRTDEVCHGHFYVSYAFDSSKYDAIKFPYSFLKDGPDCDFIYNGQVLTTTKYTATGTFSFDLTPDDCGCSMTIASGNALLRDKEKGTWSQPVEMSWAYSFDCAECDGRQSGQ